MFARVLVPLDRSSLAEQAIGQAAAIARASNAPIDVVSVYQPIVLDSAPWEPVNLAVWEDMHRYLETITAELASGAGLRATYGVLEGDAVERICHHSRDVAADLIVMTSHGRTGLSRAWLGSVADGLIRHAHVPVLLLRPIASKTSRAAAHHLFKHVLVPLDGSTQAEDVLPAAVALAKCGGAHLSLLRVVEPVPVAFPEAGIPVGYMPALVDDPATQGLEQEATRQVYDVARRVREEYAISVTANVEVDHGVGRTIVEFARTHDADVVAMSTHGRGASRLLLGSVADEVLRGGGLPLLAYRPVGRAMPAVGRRAGVMAPRERSSSW